MEGSLGRRSFFKTSLLGFTETEQQLEHLPLLLPVFTSSNIEHFDYPKGSVAP